MRLGRSNAFTIVEIVIVITVIAILSTMSVITFNSVRQDSRDAARQSNATIISEALEKYYEKNGEYPSVASIVNNDPTNTGEVVAERLSIPADSLLMPNMPVNVTNSLTSNPSPTENYIAYIAKGVDSESTTKCQNIVDAGCDQFELKYLAESGEVITIASRHSSRKEEVPNPPNVIATLSGHNDVIATVTPTEQCASGLTQKYTLSYRMKMESSYPWSNWTPFPPFSESNTHIIGSSPGISYEFIAKTRCDNGGVAGEQSEESAPYLFVHPQPTIFVFDTNAPGCGDTVQLPISMPASGGNVDWGDGTVQPRVGSLMQHTYTTPGEYTVRYTGPIDQASYYSSVNATNARCLTKVEQWGDEATPAHVSFYRATNLAFVAEPPNTVTNMSHMFESATNYNQSIGDWDTSNVTDMSYMFAYAKNFNQPIDNWDTSNVTDMSYMFSSLNGSPPFSFNQPIGSWDTSNVTDMSYMFADARSFNQSIGNWDTSNVTNMSYMFRTASAFNKAINTWNVSNVTDMSYMFSYANIFNQPLSNWNVSSATDMSYMFYGARDFNQPINNWNTSNVTNMAGMFGYYVTYFNQPLDDWNVSKVTSIKGMFEGAVAFNQPLNSWDTSNVTDMSTAFMDAREFNQPLSNWNTSKVTNMSSMFRRASIFNQNISSWNVTGVTSFDSFRLSSNLTTANTPPKFR